MPRCSSAAYGLCSCRPHTRRSPPAWPCAEADADRFVAEQARVGALLGAEPLPVAAATLSDWIARHPDAAASPAGDDAVAFLLRPPLHGAVRAAYGRLFRAAVATLPPRIRIILGIAAHRGGVQAGRLAVGALRHALGPSPEWQLALARTGARPPAGREISPGLARGSRPVAERRRAK